MTTPKMVKRLTKRLNPFDVIHQLEEPKEQVVESRLSIQIRHLPIEPHVLREAYFEIERRSKNVITEVFTEFGITVQKEKFVKIEPDKT